MLLVYTAMEELAKALAEAVRTGTELAWPALVLYMVTQALTPIALTSTVLGGLWIVTRAVLAYPERERMAQTAEEQRRVELRQQRQAIDEAGYEAEFAHKKRLRELACQ